MDPNVQTSTPHERFFIRVSALFASAILIVVLSSLGTYWYLKTNKDLQTQTQQPNQPFPTEKPTGTFFPNSPVSSTPSNQQTEVACSPLPLEFYEVAKRQANSYCGDNSGQYKEVLDAVFNSIWGGKEAKSPAVSVIRLKDNFAMGNSYVEKSYSRWLGIKSNNSWSFSQPNDICETLKSNNFPPEFLRFYRCA